LVDIITVSTVITTVSVGVGIVFALLELRHLTKTRRTDVILRIYERFASKEIVGAIMAIGSPALKGYDEYMEKNGVVSLVQVLQVFDEVGILLEDDLVDIRLVNSLFGPSLNTHWESRLKELLEGMRKASSQPSFFKHVDYLLERLDNYRQKTTGSS
jgi:hypothetical protein